MTELTLLPNGYWGIGDIPCYEFVKQQRLKTGLTGGRFAKAKGIERSSHYAFEAGQNRSLNILIKEMNAVGFPAKIVIRDIREI